jgi:uncharacterized protein YfaS (alpha-2-macroglobulin family)
MEGLKYRLSEGEPSLQAQPLVSPAQTTLLSDEEIQHVLDRLPPFPIAERDREGFAFPEESLPPPRPGKISQDPFPPRLSEGIPERKAPRPLEVLRRAPEGEVSIAPNLSVTFSQPMVALTGHDDMKAEVVPVKLTPEPPGSWRWVGTRTLVFEPEGRFPMATDYSVEIPAGTSSALGGQLNEVVGWHFSTSPAKIQTSHPTPRGAHRRDAMLFVAFDQRIDPQKVLETVRGNAAGKEYSLRLASREEIEADANVLPLAEEAGDGWWLALRPTELFPADSVVRVDIGPGTPSAEGPRRTPEVQRFFFRTYGSLRVEKHGCTRGEGECPPFAPWFVEFNNSLDEDAFDESWIKIEPELPNAKIEVNYYRLTIQGNTQGRTTYQVRLNPALRDRFGQTLCQEISLSFKVGPAQPQISFPARNFVILDPAAPPALGVFTMNYPRLNVRLHAVRPEDWQAFQTFRGERDKSGSRSGLPGRLILQKTVDLKAEADQMVETRIDLAPALPDGLGQVIVEIEPIAEGLKSFLGLERQPRLHSWVQSTRIGLDAFADNESLTVWANSLQEGLPLEGAKIILLPSGAEAVTGPDGIAKLPLPPPPDQLPKDPILFKLGLELEPQLLVARRGEDVAFLPGSLDFWRGEVKDRLCWYVFDDRGMYRPGEEVHVKGWIRQVGGGKNGDVEPLGGAATQVHYRLVAPRGKDISSGKLNLNALGGFDGSFKLPDRMNLGEASLKLTAADGAGENLLGREYSHAFQVEEFRRPEYEVSISTSEGPFIVGQHALAWVTAQYYAGGTLPNAETTWSVAASSGKFNPPGWEEFTFGLWTPWWMEDGRLFPEAPQTHKAMTDASGIHRLRIDFEATSPPYPYTIRAEATVMDVNRQAWSASKILLVHPAENYVGLRCERIFVSGGQPLKIEAVVSDLDGNTVPGRVINLQTFKVEWSRKKGSWQEEEVEVQKSTLKSALDPVAVTFELARGGTYRFRATIEDSAGRENQSEITRWVSGGERPISQSVEQENVILIPNQQEYRPGDTAEILVQSPFWPAEGLVTLCRSGMVLAERIRIDGPSYTVQVPIQEAHIPNVHIQVDLVGSAPRTDEAGKIAENLPPRPAFAMGNLNLLVPPLARQLSLKVSPRDNKLAPGGETMVDIALRDAASKPVAGGEVALVVVDEAILSLTNYRLADPLNIFYKERPSEVRNYHSRQDVKLAGLERSQVEAEIGEGEPEFSMQSIDPSLAMAGPEPIRMRLDFNPLAAFSPSVVTDAEGYAQVPVKLPDNLTRYRVMAVAVAGGKQFGAGESTITAWLPLMVRPSPPRFLNFGDRFELSIGLQNQTDEDMAVDVALRAANMELTAGAGRRVSVPANDRVEVRYPAVSVNAGVARFQVGAVAGRLADATQKELPVWTPATSEAFAAYGEIDEGSIEQPVIAPGNIYPQFGGLELTTSATALQALSDAVLYLVSYPFECSEQIASRILSVAALKDILSAFEAEGLPSPEKIIATIQKDIQKLQSLQNDDGGFPIWRRGEKSWPYHSIHVAHALARAQAKGFSIPWNIRWPSKKYLQDIEKRIPSNYGKQARPALMAYALYVRAQLGERDVKAARQVISSIGLDKLPPEAMGWLLTVFSGEPSAADEIAAVRLQLNNCISETAGAASFASPYEEQGYLLLHSDRRTDGIILEALIADQPQNDLIPKLVRGLMAHREKGRWNNTQENAFILLALDRYFRTYETVAPDFMSRAWLGERFAGQVPFKGRTTESRRINIPMTLLADKKQQDVILSKEGPGRLYYRLGLRYAPRELRPDPADYGFTVERTYEAVDKPEDVQRQEDGTWLVKAGARVRVKLTVVAEARRYHVALIDPLPAGFEALNPALAVTGSIPTDKDRTETQQRFYWWGPWFEHQNLRDERAEAFVSLLWDGVYTYTYVARATTLGKFIVPPARAEEMYSPEVFGRSRGDVVIIR